MNNPKYIPTSSKKSVHYGNLPICNFDPARFDGQGRASKWLISQL